MPRYEFLCRECEQPFERLYSMAEYEREKKSIECPKCRSKSVARQISAVEVKTSKKS